MDSKSPSQIPTTTTNAEEEKKPVPELQEVVTSGCKTRTLEEAEDVYKDSERVAKRLRCLFGGEMHQDFPKLLGDLRNGTVGDGTLALEQLRKIMDRPTFLAFFRASGHIDVIHAMACHGVDTPGHRSFQVEALTSLVYFSQHRADVAGENTEAVRKGMIAAGVLDAALVAMESLPKQESVASLVLNLTLNLLAAFPNKLEAVKALDLVTFTVTTMKNFRPNKLHVFGCKILLELTKCKSIHDRSLFEKGEVLTLLAALLESPSVQNTKSLYQASFEAIQAILALKKDE